jgi:hypothetical protein
MRKGDGVPKKFRAFGRRDVIERILSILYRPTFHRFHWNSSSVSKHMLVITDVANPLLHYPVDLGIRHHTLLCDIAASDNAYSLFYSLPAAQFREYTRMGFVKIAICRAGLSIRPR